MRTNSVFIFLMISSVNSFFLKPSIYDLPPANKIICNNYKIDESTMPVTSSSMPYLECANEGLLRIDKAELILSKRKMCPLNYIGPLEYNGEGRCESPSRLLNKDATTAMKELCNGKSKCVFHWDEIPNLACTDGDIKKASNTVNLAARNIRRIKRSASQKTNLKAKLETGEYDDYENEDSNEYDDYDQEDSDVYGEDYPEYSDYNVHHSTKLHGQDNFRLMNAVSNQTDQNGQEEDEKVVLLVLRYIANHDQALNVTFTCSTNRPKFRPFSNKRYSTKFSPSLSHPERKLSYNRLQELG